MRDLEASTPATAFYPGGAKKKVPPELNFHERLAAFRKQPSLTRPALAGMVAMHVSQIRRYESGQSQPTLGAIRKLAMALNVSADMLLFAQDARGPGDDLRLQFEAVCRFDEEEKRVVRSLLEGMILKHEGRRWQNVSANGGERK